jgi:hypothetical protein
MHGLPICEIVLAPLKLAALVSLKLPKVQPVCISEIFVRFSVESAIWVVQRFFGTFDRPWNIGDQKLRYK